MSRLYYDVPAAVRQLDIGKRRSARNYLEKVAKLVPTEIVAGYLTVIGLVPAIRLIPEANHAWVYVSAFLAFLLLTVWYVDYQAEPGRPKKTHIIVSTIAFVVWAYAISGDVVWPAAHDSALASIILVVFSVVSGKIPLT